MTFEPGLRIGQGRSADVFSLGEDRVVRRYRNGRNALGEAELMVYLAEMNYPVPEVFDASGPDIVMARLDGSTMLKTLSRQPWRIKAMARLLTELQMKLNAIAPPVGMTACFGEPDGILHLDFHPDNVMLTKNGPIVIDFSNAVAGPGGADVAQSWIIMATSTIPGSVVERFAGSTGRRQLVRSYLRAADLSNARPLLRQVADARKLDVNTTDAERTRIEQLVARVIADQK